MSLHPVLAEKLSAALAPMETRGLTRRDARLSAVPGKAHAVIGMRRAGKTTFLHQLLHERRTRLRPERALYLSFDDDRLADLGVEQLGFLLEEYCRRHPGLRGREIVSWYLDEIQLVSGWERFVRRVLDSEKIEIVVSGSSARLLSREVHTSLRGRGMATVIRPFSFRELLRHRGEEPGKAPSRWRAAERSLVESRFRSFPGMCGSLVAADTGARASRARPGGAGTSGRGTVAARARSGCGRTSRCHRCGRATGIRMAAGALSARECERQVGGSLAGRSVSR